ncbi:DUF5320 domain-containing protein [Gemmatimonadota bacterium]
MPRGDRKGPTGDGPRTGRGVGNCTGNEEPGNNTPGLGRGFGMRFWRRRSSRGDRGKRDTVGASRFRRWLQGGGEKG